MQIVWQKSGCHHQAPWGIGAVLAALAFLPALIPPGGQKAPEQQSYPMAPLL